MAVSLALGRTTGEIAAETGRSVTTIKWHLRHIFAKHGLSRQVQLVMALGGVPGIRR